VARQLRQLGIRRVRPLLGGFHGWREHGYPLEEFYPQEAAAKAATQA
jgi:3-mercaptopyruvate sulfurtransferase SseA